MTPTAPVQWGIVGCGWVARDYVAPAMAASSTVRLMAVSDPDPAALSRVAHDTAEIARKVDLADFLETPGLEAVYVATPNHLHRTIVEAAARAGKHVLCEKPMATSLADAEAMVAACRENGVRYATAFDQRFQARHRRLRELVREGRLGTVTAVRVHYACWTPPTGRHPRRRARTTTGGLIPPVPGAERSSTSRRTDWTSPKCCSANRWWKPSACCNAGSSIIPWTMARLSSDASTRVRCSC